MLHCRIQPEKGDMPCFVMPQAGRAAARNGAPGNGFVATFSPSLAPVTGAGRQVAADGPLAVGRCATGWRRCRERPRAVATAIPSGQRGEVCY